MLNAYQAEFHVKKVTLYTFPYLASGVSLGPLGGTSQAGIATLSPAFAAFAKTIPAGTEIDISGSYAYGLINVLLLVLILSKGIQPLLLILPLLVMR